MSIGKRLRFRILGRDNFTCLYCGRKPPEVALEVDHVVPRSNGGSDRADNLVTACQDCNRSKAALRIPRELLPSAVLPFCPSGVPDEAFDCGDWCPHCPATNVNIMPVRVETVGDDRFKMSYRGPCGHEWETFYDRRYATALAHQAKTENFPPWPAKAHRKL